MKKLLKILLGGSKNINKIRLYQNRLTLIWLTLASRSTLLLRIHYAFFSNAFDQEANAVVAGHLKFLENQKGTEPINYFLRRAIHRLEKGLIMEPRRDVFATDYIEETVNAYEKSLRENGTNDELNWAEDVLNQYFQATLRTPTIDRAKNKFRHISLSQATQTTRTPFKFTPTLSPVNYNEMLALSKRRRSVRWYQDKAVSRQDIDEAIAVALQAPSACNRHPYRFIIFDDPKSIAKVAQLPMGAKGFEHNFPVLIALVGRLRAYPHPRDRHVIYVDGGLAAMSLMFALETKGLASCPINWPDIKSKELAAAKQLKLDTDERIIMFMSVGYARADGLIPYSQKLAASEAREYNPSLS